MARESLLRRVLLTLRFIFVYIVVVLFKDIPRILFERRKKIEGQVVVITGGAMGIGKEVAKILSVEHYAKVVILDVNEKESFKTVEEITTAGGTAFFYKCDISNAENIQEVTRNIHEDPRLGFVDILIANAAILKFGELLDLTYDDFRLNSNVNILGHIYTVKSFLPKMVEAKKGQIVSIGSICSHYGEHYGTAYCSAKFACRGFMEALQGELLEKGLDNIILTNIYSYFVKTNFISNIEEPFSTFFNVMTVDKCASEIVDAILKEKVAHYIPGGIGILCRFLKCLTTKSAYPHGRKLFNFTYKPKFKEEKPKPEYVV